MKKLLMKEFSLALHPTNIIFLLFGAMLLIPSYPYYVVFFYTALGIFFVCLTGRENRDIAYSMLLPVRKSDIVRARMLFACVLETAQAVLCVPFILLRQWVMPFENPVGMDANWALLGFAFVLLGVFNAVFFPKYYQNPNKVGGAFLWGSFAMMLFMLASEMLVHIIPFFRDVLDGMDSMHQGVRLLTLLTGFMVYGLLNVVSCRKACRIFEKLDL